MLFRSHDLEAIFAGRRGLAFRRWKKPTVKAGGSVRTARGMVGIDSVEAIEPETVTEAEAQAAGYPDRAAVLAMFASQEGTCYRIRLHPAGPDPREALRDATPTEDEIASLRTRLARLDRSAGDGPWTRQTLELIARQPGVVSTRLAESLGRDRAAFKQDVRKLKALGLTVSLETGYRLSPRGAAVLAQL